MSGLLENAIRPFQTRDITPPKRSQTSAASGSSGPVSVIVGGTPALDSQLIFTFASTAVPGSPVTVTYTLLDTDDLQAATIGIMNAINNNSSLKAVGIYATGIAGTLTQFTISQPDSLSPQATITGSATDALTVALSTGNVLFQPGRGKAQIKTLSATYSYSQYYYVIKYPKEVTLSDLDNFKIPFLPRITIRFRVGAPDVIGP